MGQVGWNAHQDPIVDLPVRTSRPVSIPLPEVLRHAHDSEAAFGDGHEGVAPGFAVVAVMDLDATHFAGGEQSEGLVELQGVLLADIAGAELGRDAQHVGVRPEVADELREGGFVDFGLVEVGEGRGVGHDQESLISAKTPRVLSSRTSRYSSRRRLSCSCIGHGGSLPQWPGP